MNDLIVAPSSQVATDLAGVAGFIEQSLAPATRRAYASAWADFVRWCGIAGVGSLPATAPSVARYVASLAHDGRKVSTIRQRLAAIRWAHEAKGYPSPCESKGVRSTMAGIARAVGVAPIRKSPLTVDRVAAVLAHCRGKDLKSIRDRALVLFGFASAMRRSELVSLTIDDLEETAGGLLVTLRRSKTDQEGQGHQRAIPFGRRATCPVAAVKAWLDAAGITEGQIFRRLDRHGNVGEALGEQAVASIVKQLAKRAGLDPSDFAAHSLRAGFVTSAAEAGRSTDRIMDHTGHQSAAMIRVYTRRSDAFRDHAGAGLL